MQETILVIGATGTLGEPVARCLKEDEFHGSSTNVRHGGQSWRFGKTL